MRRTYAKKSRNGYGSLRNRVQTLGLQVLSEKRKNGNGGDKLSGRIQAIHHSGKADPSQQNTAKKEVAAVTSVNVRSLAGAWHAGKKDAPR